MAKTKVQPKISREYSKNLYGVLRKTRLRDLNKDEKASFKELIAAEFIKNSGRPLDKKHWGTLATAFGLTSKIANATNEEEFYSFLCTGQTPAVKLTKDEMEVLKGGGSTDLMWAGMGLGAAGGGLGFGSVSGGLAIIPGMIVGAAAGGVIGLGMDIWNATVGSSNPDLQVGNLRNRPSGSGSGSSPRPAADWTVGNPANGPALPGFFNNLDFYAVKP